MSEINKVKKKIREFVRRADIFLLAVCILCSIFGVITIRKAVVTMSNPTKYVIVQVFSIFLGIGVFILLTIIDADILGSQWKVLCVINMLLLVALVIFGQDDGTGNKSWIRFAGIGVQPSEVIKVIYIIVAAKQMTYLKEYKDINSFMSVVQMVAHFGIVFVLIVGVSSDLGSATIIMAVFIVMFFVAGIKLYWFGIGGAAIAAVIPLMWKYFLHDYQKQRLIAPYDPTIDPTGYGITWQTTQSRQTLSSGMLTGVEEGYKYSFFTGKHTDFIFSSVGENFGMIGCLIVIVLLLVIIIHCVRVGLHSGRFYDMLICFGVAGAVGWQTFINIGMCMGITPVIGITLPFFSYGGSSMVTMFGAMGLVSGVKYKPKPQLYSMYGY